MLKLPTSFKDKYNKLLGTEKAQDLFKAMNEDSKKAFRVNSLKAEQEISYNLTQPVPDISNAYYGEVAGEDPEWVSGYVYSQDPAAMFPAAISGVKPGDKVLDLCAAPGGKTTALGEQLKNEGLLVANEISATRSKALRENIERWGISNTLITNESLERLAPVFPEFFDVILVDAPCSGEGMFRKNPDAIDYWSLNYLLTCQQRQKDILAEAVKMLKPGGRLVYSTCTFSPEEDEQIVSWLVGQYHFSILKTGIKDERISLGHPEWADDNPELVNTLRFWPQDGIGEGQFAAVLQKSNTASVPKIKKKHRKKKGNRAATCLSQNEQELIAKVLDHYSLPVGLIDWRKKALVRKDHVFVPVISLPVRSDLHILNNGVELGILKKKRFEPSHQLAEVLGQIKQERVVDLSIEDYRKYLHGETVKVKSKFRGFILVSCQRLIFSFGKVANNEVLKNFYPKGLRK